jgi:hypothetical protein
MGETYATFATNVDASKWYDQRDLADWRAIRARHWLQSQIIKNLH